MPIKRNEYLKAISREHHHGLLLCWKIRAGIKNKIEPARIKKYVNWFYANHIIDHFEVEEKYIFSILDDDHKLVKKAITEHRRLKRLFEAKVASIKNLTLLEEELESHIRFEERVLFNEIQAIATEEQLKLIALHHNEEKFSDNTLDPFWEK